MRPIFYNSKIDWWIPAVVVFTVAVAFCIQAKEGSLGNYTATDAEINDRENLL